VTLAVRDLESEFRARTCTHEERRVMTAGQTSHDPIPNACTPPTNEAIVAGRAGTVGLRQVAPSIECRFLDPAWSNARAAGSREVNVTWSSRLSLAFEAIAPGNRFEFDPDRILDGNHGSCLEFKSRPGRAYLVRTANGSSQSTNICPPHSPTLTTNNSILKLAGAFHCVKTSSIRFWAFSYSVGDPCGRSNQLIMYFIGILHYLAEILGTTYSGTTALRIGHRDIVRVT